MIMIVSFISISYFIKQWGLSYLQESHPVSILNSMPITYLFTYSMVQSPSWEANWFEDSQEIPRISRNPKVHYRTHKPSPTVSILSQPNPVHIPTSHLLEVHPNIIHPSTPRSPQWYPSLRFPQQDPIHPLSSPISVTCRSILILSTHLRLGLPRGSFPLVSPPRPYTPHLLTHTRHMPSPSHSDPS